MADLPRLAFVLAGGLGTRLGPLTSRTPKPMLPVAGRPFIEHVLRYLKKEGIARVILSVGHLGEIISGHLGDGSRFGLGIEYAVESSPAGTGGALVLARDLLPGRFVVVNGDTIFNASLETLTAVHEKHGAAATLALLEVPDVSRFGAVKLNGGLIGGFAEKGRGGPGLINAGVYLLEKNVIGRIPAPPSSLERDLFPALAAEGALAGSVSDGFFLDMGTPESYAGSHGLVSRWLEGLE